MNHSCFKLLSDNSKVPGPPDAHSLQIFIYLFFLFGMFWNFFLLAGHGVLIKETAVNRPGLQNHCEW